MKGHQVPRKRAIMHFIADYRLSRAGYLAARLKLTDVFGDSRPALGAAAAATATRPEALRRLLRALTAHGIFRKDARRMMGPSLRLSDAALGGPPLGGRG